MDPEPVDAGVDHVPVVGENLEFNQGKWYFWLAGKVKCLYWRPFVIVSKVALE